MNKNIKRKINALLLVLVLVLLQLFAFAGCSLPVSNSDKSSSDLSSLFGSETTGSSTDESATSTESTTGTTTQQSNTTDSQAVQTVTKPGTIPVVLYYQDADGYLIPVTRWVEKQQGIAKAALAGLTDSAITREELQYFGLYPVIPVNTDILGISIKEGTATVDFDKNVLNLADKGSEQRMLTSMVYTLTGFKTITGVRFLINGYEQKTMKNGTDMSGIFDRSRMMINSTEDISGSDMHKADVFLLRRANDNYTYFVPVSVTYTSENTEPDPLKLFEMLLQKPGDDNLFSEIPQGTEISSTSLKNGILTVDFNESIAESGGNAKEEAIMRQILYTAGQLKDVTKVKMLIDGKTLEMSEGTDLSAPVGVPTSINSVIDAN